MPADDRLDSGERLDALLNALRSPHLAPAAWPGDEALAPLLAAAHALQPLRQATPSVAFTRVLEAHLLAEDALLAADEAATRSPMERAAPAATEPVALTERADRADRADRGLARRSSRRRRGALRRILWPAIAAAVLVALGTLGAAAAAEPGSPLFALHRLEQSARSAFVASPADRVRLHLQYAQDDLGAANSAARSGQSGSYADALSSLRSEMETAAADLRGVPEGAEHDSLASALAALRAQAVGDLRDDLPALSWSQRLSTTDALAAFGDNVPRVISATATRVRDGSSHTWRVQLTGTGLTSGARLLVDGVPAGTVVSAAQTTVIAMYTAADGQAPASLGVAGLDDTAAETTTVSIDTHDEPVPTGTSGPSGPSGTPGASGNGGQGGSRSGSGGHSGGGRDSTPTPNPHNG